MRCGVIFDQLILNLQKKPDNNNDHLRSSSRRRSRSTNEQVCFCVSFKTHNNNSNNSLKTKTKTKTKTNTNTNTNTNDSVLLIENQQQLFIRSKSYYSSNRFRTKATIKDGDNLVVLSDDENSSSSLYQLLGISESGSSFSEIKQAYKQLARKYHPDVSPPDRAEEYTKRFILVQEAYEILSDPNRRAMYDRDLARGLHLAFSARKRYYHHYDHHHEGEIDERSNWKNRWQTQLSGLKKKSMNRDSSNDNMSWGARMRRQRNEHSEES